MRNVLCEHGASGVRGYSTTSLRFVEQGPWTLATFGGAAVRPCQRHLPTSGLQVAGAQAHGHRVMRLWG